MNRKGHRENEASRAKKAQEDDKLASKKKKEEPKKQRTRTEKRNAAKKNRRDEWDTLQLEANLLRKVKRGLMTDAEMDAELKRQRLDDSDEENFGGSDSDDSDSDEAGFSAKGKSRGGQSGRKHDKNKGKVMTKLRSKISKKSRRIKAKRKGGKKKR